MRLPKLRSNALFSNSILIFIIRFFPAVANLLVLLYYSRHLDKTAYGTYQNFWIQLNIFYPIACFGIHALITTYAPELIVKLARSISAKQYTIYASWLLALSGGFALLQSSGLGFVLPFLFLFTFASGIILESFLIIFKNYKSLSLINLLYAVAFLLVHHYVLMSGYSNYKLFSALLVLNIIRSGVSLTIAGVNIRQSNGDTTTELRPLKEIRTLWLHLGFYDVLQTLSGWIDKFFVSIFLTAALSGIYFNGTQNIPFLPLILSATGSAVLIQMAHVKAADEKEALRQHMNNSARYLSNIVFPLFFFLLFFRHELFAVFFPGFEAAVPIFLVSLFMLPFRTYSFITVFQKLHKGYLSNIGALGELVLAGMLMYPLYRWLGMPGIMLSFIISSYAQGAFYFYHMSRLMDTKAYNLIPIVNWAIKIIVFGTVFMIVHYLVTLFFRAGMSLFIGVITMSITVLAALFIEITTRRNVISTTEEKVQ